jgi:phosphatidylglycerol:prolipoprotein diacylglycerol transferase
MMTVSGLFLILYGLFRFIVELVRMPDAHIGYLWGEWLTMGQLLSLPMVIAGVIIYVLAFKMRQKPS